jgi:predicted nucleotidyltransferase
MTNILPLRSGTIDPIFVDMFRAVDTVARTTGHDFLVFGATARDLVLEGVFGIKAVRKTRDVDLAFALRSWDEYDALRQALVASGRFMQAARIAHRLYFGSALEVDIVPFGALESPPGEIAWPPDGAVRMKTFGLDRARSDALIVELADGLRIHVASIRTQALLKVVAWADRESEGVYRDASDLAFLLKSYWEVVQSSDRPQAFWRALAPLLDAPNFNAEITGALILGREVRELLQSPTEIDMVGRIIVKGLGEDGLGPLVLRSGLAEEAANQLLSAFWSGLAETPPLSIP